MRDLSSSGFKWQIDVAVSAGLSLIATCTTNACAKKNQTQWLSLGLGQFIMSEVCYSTLCSSCNVDFETIEHVIIRDTTYSLKGQTKDRTRVAIADKKIDGQSGLMINHLSIWKYLNINLK